MNIKLITLLGLLITSCSYGMFQEKADIKTSDIDQFIVTHPKYSHEKIACNFNLNNLDRINEYLDGTHSYTIGSPRAWIITDFCSYMLSLKKKLNLSNKKNKKV